MFNNRTLSNTLSVYKTYWNMDKYRMVSIILITVLVGIRPTIGAYLYKLVVDELVVGVQLDAFALDKLSLLLGLFLLVGLVGQILYRLKGTYGWILQNKLTHHLHVEVAAKIPSLDVASFEDDKFHDDLEQVRNYSMYRFPNYFESSLDVLMSVVELISLTVVLIQFPLFILLAVVFSIPSFWVERIKSKKRFDWVRSHRANRRKRGYFFSMMMRPSVIGEIKLYRLGDFFVDKIKQTIDVMFKQEIKIEMNFLWLNILVVMVTMLAEGLAYVYVIYLLVSSLATVGDVPFFIGRFASLGGTMRNLTRNIRRMQEDNDYVESYYKVMNTKPSFNPAVGRLLATDKIEIEMKDVWFKYPGTDKYALSGVNLHIADGEKVALVGQNGAGKSTLVKLLARFYDPEKGQILINGIDIQEYNLDSVYERVGILFQDYNRYHIPIAENIGVGDISKVSDRGLIEQAATKAGAHEMIVKQTGGYDQMLGKAYEKGTELSGGEWQKLALARAYLRDPEVLILDEPTAAIDAKAEAEIFEKLQELGEGKSLVLISHRFSTVKQVDKIYVVEEGVVKEQGSHKELMNLDGRYAEMYSLQARMYE